MPLTVNLDLYVMIVSVLRDTLDKLLVVNTVTPFCLLGIADKPGLWYADTTLT